MQVRGSLPPVLNLRHPRRAWVPCLGEGSLQGRHQREMLWQEPGPSLASRVAAAHSSGTFQNCFLLYFFCHCWSVIWCAITPHPLKLYKSVCLTDVFTREVTSTVKAQNISVTPGFPCVPPSPCLRHPLSCLFLVSWLFYLLIPFGDFSSQGCTSLHFFLFLFYFLIMKV